MSLINDALKRANEVKPADPMADVDAASLHPVQAPKTALSWVWYTVAIMGAVLLASWAIVIGIWAARQTKLETARTQQLIAAETSPSSQKSGPAAPSPAKHEQALEAATVVPASAPLAVTTSIVSTPTAIPPSIDAAKDVPLGTSIEPAATEPPKPAVPTFKLQAIFYREANPAVVINSRTLHRGDKILNARVVSIERESVTLERDGEKLVLELQMQ